MDTTLPKNTFTDFLGTLRRSTAKGSVPAIFCPKCGKRLTLLKPHSVQPFLSKQCREASDRTFGDFRSWVAYIADSLRDRNFGLPETNRVVGDPGTSENLRKLATGKYVQRYDKDGGSVQKFVVTVRPSNPPLNDTQPDFVLPTSRLIDSAAAQMTREQVRSLYEKSLRDDIFGFTPLSNDLDADDNNPLRLFNVLKTVLLPLCTLGKSFTDREAGV